MLYTENMLTFPQWLLAKVQEFEKQQGRRTSLDAFAAYVGVSRPLISQWLSGRTKPSLENVRRISLKFGSEIYDVLGLPRPDPVLQDVINAWPYLSEETRRSIREQAVQLTTKSGEPQIDGRTSESHP
jgi:transcriptional regulator with XRE-family HTH domain